MSIRKVLVLCLSVFTFALSAQSNSQKTVLDKKTQKQYTKAVACLKKKKHEKGAKKIEEIIAKNPDFVRGRETLVSYYRAKGKDEMAVKHLEYLSKGRAIAAISNALQSDKLKAEDKKALDRRLGELKFRKSAYENPVEFNPESLGEAINTGNSEYLPAFNADGSTMIYSSRNTLNLITGWKHFDIYGMWQKGFLWEL